MAKERFKGIAKTEQYGGAMENHSPLPWSRDSYGHVQDAQGEDVCFHNVSLSSGEQADANTALMFNAVNSHAALIAALEYAENELRHLASGHVAIGNVNLALDKINTALAKARQ